MKSSAAGGSAGANARQSRSPMDEPAPSEEIGAGNWPIAAAHVEG
jgi:hypothetical protein